MQYDDLTRVIEPTHEAFIAKLTVSRHGKYLTTLYPEKRLYFAQNQPTTEVALRTSPLEDLYIIMAGFEPSKTVTLKVFVNPLVFWMWMGGLVGPGNDHRHLARASSVWSRTAAYCRTGSDDGCAGDEPMTVIDIAVICLMAICVVIGVGEPRTAMVVSSTGP